MTGDSNVASSAVWGAVQSKPRWRPSHIFCRLEDDVCWRGASVFSRHPLTVDM